MKTTFGAMIGLGLALLTVPSSGMAQGSLTPPGTPAPTMKSLDQIEPRTPISALPFTISQPGSYYLTKSLVMTSAAAGITIASDNVSIDLRGYTLDGNNVGLRGITVDTNRRGLQVRNGSADNWKERGFDLQYCFSGVLENLSATNDVIGIYANSARIIRCAASNCTNMGFEANFATVRDCTLESNAIGISSQSSVIENCYCGDSSNTGYSVSRSVVANCHSVQDHYGIVSNESSNIHHNEVLYSSSDGIRLVGGSTMVADNNVSGAGSAGTGIWCQSDENRIVHNNVTNCTNGGIGVVGSYNTIDGNSVLRNGVGATNIGISVAGTKNTVVRNSSLGNGSPVNNYSIATGNNPGPIDAANASTNSWSNTQ